MSATPMGWFNRAREQSLSGDDEGALASLNEALALQAYFLPALLAKGRVLAKLGREEDGLALYRAFLPSLPDDSGFPEPIREQIAKARALVAADSERRAEAYAAALAEVAAAFPEADMRRAQAFAEQRAGRRKVFVQQPTGGHFPYLPAIEFFDRGVFSWLETIERETDVVKAELLSLLAEEHEGFRPYVAYDPTQPANQWAELNHSLRWSAWFLWQDGSRNDANCARCPATAAAVEKLPLLDTPGKGPSVMFSILRPRSRIPPHTGTTNARVTVHLPLIVPPGCGFRVGADTREWREGQAWAFDDTIEHEAWNDSDDLRALLIFDVWNPFLTEAERAAVRAIG